MICDDHQDQDVHHLEDYLSGRDVSGSHQHPPAPLLEVDVVVESHDEVLGISQTRHNTQDPSSSILLSDTHYYFDCDMFRSRFLDAEDLRLRKQPVS